MTNTSHLPEIGPQTRGVFFTFVALFSVVTLGNFVLTANPYAAFHSFDLPGTSQMATYFVAPVYLLIGVGVICVVRVNRLTTIPSVLLLVALLGTSGLALGLWGTLFRTYASMAVLFVLIGIFATHEATRTFEQKEIPHLKAITRWFCVLVILGLVLALMFDGVYGRVPFEFSRISRGEVTLWNLSGLLVLFPAMALVAYRQHRMRYPLLLLGVMIVVIASTVTRAAIVTTVLPIVIVAIFHLRGALRSLAILAGIGVLALSWRPLLQSFSTIGGNTMEDATSGRSSLWDFHTNTFFENPIFGAGQLIAVRSAENAGNAAVETGLLAWFSENGIFFGLLAAFLVARAAWTAVKLLQAGSATGAMPFFISVVMLAQIPSLLEKFSKILTIEDFAFWFAVFYLNAISSLTRSRTRPENTGPRPESLAAT